MAVLIYLSIIMSGCGSKAAFKDTGIGSETISIQEKSTEQQRQRTPAEHTYGQRETVKLCMVGDILLHDTVNDSGRQEDGSYNYDHLFFNVRDEVAKADVALVNQEVILGGTELGLSGYPTFNGAYEVGDALAEAGFDVTLHATNHALDKGKTGINNCLAFWQTNYPRMAVLGINESQKARDDIYIREEQGIKIAVLNYTYGTNGIPLPEDMPYAVNLLEEEQVARDVERAKEMADFVMVCPHWGTEYSHEISSEQEKWTDIFADLGVDLMIGTHPHVIEPVEWVTGENGDRMLVYYSLGNFVNATSGTGSGTADRMLGAMAEVTIQKEQDKTVITDYQARPLICHLEQGKGKITTYFMEDYSKELAERNEIRKQDSGFTLEYCQNLWDEVMGDFFKSID